MSKPRCAVLAALALLGFAMALSRPVTAGRPESTADLPRYTAEGELVPPAHYREWVFLSSSIDMSYSATPVHQFDNVFAPRAAYRAFLKTGVWPDKTVLILENRVAASKGSITKSGQFQNGEVIGLEAHVKDVARFKGGWGFFAFDGGKPGKMFPYTAACYACHQAHAAADTTFVQFYPTLLPVATKLGTLNRLYVARGGTRVQARRQSMNHVSVQVLPPSLDPPWNQRHEFGVIRSQTPR
jgi:Cytochrome P460